MSIVMDPEDLFGSRRGIYSNATGRGDSWERPTSIEIINIDGSTAYVGQCGLRIHSYSWRAHDRTKKHSFRLEFRDEYGPRKMEYKLFPDAPVDRFDSIVLRAQHGRSWAGQQYPEQAQYIRDAFARDTSRDMGKIDGHAAFVHLYLNGLYWGLYNPCQRPDTAFSATYYGGDKADWDGINSTVPVNDSQTAAWNTLMSMCNESLENNRPAWRSRNQQAQLFTIGPRVDPHDIAGAGLAASGGQTAPRLLGAARSLISAMDVAAVDVTSGGAGGGR